MAMGSGSVSNRSASEKEKRVKSSGKKESESQENVVCTSHVKRRKRAEIRVIGRRIYDPVNGKTCHQCRQKTRDFVATCTNMENNRRCTIMYCHKCLLNRYGEKAEEVAALEEWTCPKCRGICNCSICMKRRGHHPTGLLIKTAKATGFSSVSEMLLNGGEHFNHEEVVADSLQKEVIAPSPGKRGKENSFDGKVDVNLPNHVNKKSKKVTEVQKGNAENGTTPLNVIKSRDKIKSKQKGLDNVHKSTDKLVTENQTKKKKKKRDRLDEIRKETSVREDKKPKKSKNYKSEEFESKKNDAVLARRTSPRKLKVDNGVDSAKNIKNVKDYDSTLENGKRKDEKGNTENEIETIKKGGISDFRAEIPLPPGVELNSVAGIDVCMEDIGSALQFLEFCGVFGKILQLKKGEAEHVLQDLLHGRTGRRGKFSSTVQFHITLLSKLLLEQGEECVKLSASYGKGSWFVALKKYLSESKNVLKAHGLDSLDKTANYEALEASKKLRLLNILCDEVLETEKVRNWMDEQNTKHAEKIKEAKQKFTAAKEMEKSLKKKMRDDITNAIIGQHGAPLSISEHETIVSDIKRKTAEAQDKVLESKGMLSKNNEKSDAVRIEPLFVGVGGHVYWKLNCIGKSDVLHQDTGKGDGLTLNDKWFAIDDTGKEEIEKYISSSRFK